MANVIKSDSPKRETALTASLRVSRMCNPPCRTTTTLLAARILNLHLCKSSTGPIKESWQKGWQAESFSPRTLRSAEEKQFPCHWRTASPSSKYAFPLIARIGDRTTTGARALGRDGMRLNDGAIGAERVESVRTCEVCTTTGAHCTSAGAVRWPRPKGLPSSHGKAHAEGLPQVRPHLQSWDCGRPRCKRDRGGTWRAAPEHSMPFRRPGDGGREPCEHCARFLIQSIEARLIPPRGR